MLLSYFKRHKAVFITGGVFIIIFVIVFYLYNLPLEAVAYATLICLVIGLAVLGRDFLRYIQRYIKLQSVKKHMPEGFHDFPPGIDELEEEYQEMVKQLFNKRMSDLAVQEKIRTEMVDYYTLWVHQIKTPIAAMRLLLQAGDHSSTDDLNLELFKIDNYVEMVLHYLRIEGPATDFVFKQHNLDDLVKQAVRKYARLFISKKLQLDLQDIDCQVLTDQKWLVFVIEQVLANALKYTNQGTIAIYLAQSKGKVLVIEDTGVGIAANDLPRIFEHGYTGYNGRVDQHATGIGLYLSKKVMDKLSHAIELESVEGQGTKVMLDLSTVDMIIK